MAGQHSHRHIAWQSVSLCKHSHCAVFKSKESISVSANPQIPIPVAMHTPYLDGWDRKFQTGSGCSQQPFRTGNPNRTLRVLINPVGFVSFRPPRLKLFDRPANQARDSGASAYPGDTSAVLKDVKYAIYFYTQFGGEFGV